VPEPKGPEIPVYELLSLEKKVSWITGSSPCYTLSGDVKFKGALPSVFLPVGYVLECNEYEVLQGN
jgi:hypothetical protein